MTYGFYSVKRQTILLVKAGLLVGRGKKVKKLIDEIKPYYRPEAIRKFAEDLKKVPEKLVGVIRRAFRNYAKTYSVKIIEKK